MGIYDVKDQLKRWVYDRSKAAFEQGDKDRDAITSVQGHQARVKLMREKLLECVGGLPPSDRPLNARRTGTLAFDGYTIDKIVFESRPSVYVTSSLYKPERLQGPTAAVLFLCGHAENAKQYAPYQTVCRRLVAEGLIVLAMDPIGQGERFSYYEPETGQAAVRPGTHEHDHAGSACLPLGDSLARYFIHDAMRAVDYLSGLPEVDPRRIGVTGNSGGGLQTSLMMLCDDRIAAAAPGTFIMNRESYMYAGQGQDAEQIWRGMTKLGFDHEDLVLAMAPRPVIVLAVTSDFFPIEGTRRTVARTKRFWDMYGVADMPALAEDRSVHQYTPALADAAAAFFAEHLLGRKASDRKAADIVPHAPELLNCTSSGQVRGDYGDARAVFDENVDRLREIEEKLAGIPDEQRKKRALEWLRERVEGSRIVPDLNPRHLQLFPADGLRVESYIWWSQEGIFNHGFAFRDAAYDGAKLPVTIGLWERGTTKLKDKFDWIRNVCSQGRIVFVLDVTGDGVCTPHPINALKLWDWYGTVHKLTTDLFWLDDSLAAVRCHDVLRALDMARELPDCEASSVRLHARGRFNLYAEIAAALDDRIAAVETADGTDSVAAWVRSRYYDTSDTVGHILPGMLQVFDLPDLRRWRGR
ncbi:alpha/beta hydrolase [Paenibacillus sp. GYB003]|uniref:alpha/beta hydrolase n=1 Tax=Paenibacillus sp. GYB003 TaxID=2994392 RepID=UPI002F962AFF